MSEHVVNEGAGVRERIARRRHPKLLQRQPIQRFGRPLRRYLREPLELLNRATPREPVRHISLCIEARKFDHPNVCRAPVQRAGHVERMIAAGVVVVGDDRDVGPREVSGELRLPLPGTT